MWHLDVSFGVEFGHGEDVCKWDDLDLDLDLGHHLKLHGERRGMFVQ